jgi:hypothetical protein
MVGTVTTLAQGAMVRKGFRATRTGDSFGMCREPSAPGGRPVLRRRAGTAHAPAGTLRTPGHTAAGHAPPCMETAAAGKDAGDVLRKSRCATYPHTGC